MFFKIKYRLSETFGSSLGNLLSLPVLLLLVLLFFLLIALQAQALDNMKRQKGYCAATRTTHIRSWVREGGSEGGRERKKKPERSN